MSQCLASESHGGRLIALALEPEGTGWYLADEGAVTRRVYLHGAMQHSPSPHHDIEANAEIQHASAVRLQRVRCFPSARRTAHKDVREAARRHYVGMA